MTAPKGEAFVYGGKSFAFGHFPFVILVSATGLHLYYSDVDYFIVIEQELSSTLTAGPQTN